MKKVSIIAFASIRVENTPIRGCQSAMTKSKKKASMPDRPPKSSHAKQRNRQYAARTHSPVHRPVFDVQVSPPALSVQQSNTSHPFPASLSSDVLSNTLLTSSPSQAVSCIPGPSDISSVKDSVSSSISNRTSLFAMADNERFSPRIGIIFNGPSTHPMPPILGRISAISRMRGSLTPSALTSRLEAIVAQNNSPQSEPFNGLPAPLRNHVMRSRYSELDRSIPPAPPPSPVQDRRFNLIHAHRPYTAPSASDTIHHIFPGYPPIRSASTIQQPNAFLGRQAIDWHTGFDEPPRQEMHAPYFSQHHRSQASTDRPSQNPSTSNPQDGRESQRGRESRQRFSDQSATVPPIRNTALNVHSSRSMPPFRGSSLNDFAQSPRRFHHTHISPSILQTSSQGRTDETHESALSMNRASPVHAAAGYQQNAAPIEHMFAAMNIHPINQQTEPISHLAADSISHVHHWHRSPTPSRADRLEFGQNVSFQHSQSRFLRQNNESSQRLSRPNTRSSQRQTQSQLQQTSYFSTSRRGHLRSNQQGPVSVSTVDRRRTRRQEALVASGISSDNTPGIDTWPTLPHPPRNAFLKDKGHKATNLAPEVTSEYFAQAEISTPVTRLDSAQPILLVVDLNGTLLLRSQRGREVSPRPGLQDFLISVLSRPERYQLMIWTSARPHNAFEIIRSQFSAEVREKLVAVWARDRLRFTDLQYLGKTQAYKQLEWVWEDEVVQSKHPRGGEWGQTNTVLVDDSLLKGASQPWNLVNVPELTPERLREETRRMRNGEGVPVLMQVMNYLEKAGWYADVSQYLYQRRIELY